MIIDAHLHFSRHEHMGVIAREAGHVNEPGHLAQVFRENGIAMGVVMGNEDMLDLHAGPSLRFCFGVRGERLKDVSACAADLARAEKVLKTPECVVVQCADEVGRCAGGSSGATGAKSISGANGTGTGIGTNCATSARSDAGVVYYKGVAWNVREETPITLEIELPLPDDGNANVLVTQLVDEEVCNPLKVWHDLGEHPNPPKEEIELLRAAATPLVTSQRCGNKVSVTLAKNAVCYFEVRNNPIKSDRGYEYGRW